MSNEADDCWNSDESSNASLLEASRYIRLVNLSNANGNVVKALSLIMSVCKSER